MQKGRTWGVCSKVWVERAVRREEGGEGEDKTVVKKIDELSRSGRGTWLCRWGRSERHIVTEVVASS